MSTWIADVLGHGVTITVTDRVLDPLVRAAFPPGRSPAIGHLVFGVDPALSGPPVVQGGVHRWLLWSGGARGLVDCTRWLGRVTLGPEAAGNAAAGRYLMVEAACLFLATAYDRVPVHAAALVWGGRAWLVAGPPGAGKSTLAWAAARAGVGVLAEDVAYVQSRPALTVRGIARHAHLRPDVAERLRVPEIASRMVRAGGVDKVAVPLPTIAVGAVEPAGAVLLEPGPVVRLERVSPAAAAERLAANVPGGFGRFRHEIATLAPRLSARGAWRLRVPATAPEAALEPLMDLMHAGESET